MSVLTRKELDELSNILDFNTETEEIDFNNIIENKIIINIKNSNNKIVNKGILCIENNIPFITIITEKI